MRDAWRGAVPVHALCAAAWLDCHAHAGAVGTDWAVALSGAPPQALLTGGRWLPLLPAGHPGLSEVKWCMNRFAPFLVIDPHNDDMPGTRDLEEVTMEVRGDISSRSCM